MIYGVKNLEFKSRLLHNWKGKRLCKQWKSSYLLQILGCTLPFDISANGFLHERLSIHQNPSASGLPLASPLQINTKKENHDKFPVLHLTLLFLQLCKIKYQTLTVSTSETIHTFNKLFVQILSPSDSCFACDDCSIWNGIARRQRKSWRMFFLLGSAVQLRNWS